MARKYIIIAGCGRLGSRLANQLSKSGNSVVVIDNDERAFHKLSAEFSGFRIARNATEVVALQEAKIDGADCLLATTDNDNVNLMVAQIARNIFSVPVVLARVFEPSHETIYHQLGIRVISPTKLSANAFLEVLAESFKDEG